MKKNIVFLTGAGISKESGISTFRDSEDALWNNYKVKEVCTYKAWCENPSIVQDFYNVRRIEVLNAKPNNAHLEIAEFQKYYEDIFNVSIVTQNIDDLHERAGSTNVIHVHGEILKSRSSDPKYDWMGLSDQEHINNPKLYDVGRKGLNIYSDIDVNGFPLRPHVVFFGEQLHNYNLAVEQIKNADYLVIVGTSLNVYPVAAFPQLTKEECPIIYVDPTDEDIGGYWPNKTMHIQDKATEGVPLAIDEIILEIL